MTGQEVIEFYCRTKREFITKTVWTQKAHKKGTFVINEF